MLNPFAATRAIRRVRRRDDAGFALPLMALFLVSMLGVAGLVVDLGSWQVQASRIQQAADAAALAGVVQLPDGTVAATNRAVAVARDNGFDNADPDIDVLVTPLGNETLEVSVTQRNVPQYFTRVVRGDQTTTITRRSTAQYVQPVPLGSPRNYLGTNTLLSGQTSGDGIENFYLAVSDECSRREYGDRITPIAMNNQDTPAHSCDTGAGGTLANPEATTEGYLFGITVPDVAGAYPVTIQMYDAPVCTNTGGATTIFGEQVTAFDVRTTVRRYDQLDPLAGSIVSSTAGSYPNPGTFVGQGSTTAQCQKPASGGPNAECVVEATPGQSRLRECWVPLITLNAPGDYTIQVDPVTPPATNRNTRHDVFSLRAKTGAAFTPCTSDTAVEMGLLPATPPYSAACAQIYGLEHLPIYARGNDSPIFFLASIDERHNGKTMQVTLYDAAEGAAFISLLNPSGGLADFTWDVLCADGGMPTAGSCPGEANPDGGRTSGPVEVTSIPVSGTGTQPFPNNVQNGKYSDRLLRLSVKLPDDIKAAYGGRTWWKIQYGGTFTGDRTTWSVKLIGDPVRLLPNAPTTTTTTPPVN